MGSMSIVGVELNEIIYDRVGTNVPTRFLCITEEDSFSEVGKITHTEAYSFFVLLMLIFCIRLLHVVFWMRLSARARIRFQN